MSAEVPDLHYFRGSFGGKNVIPLWRDVEASEPNITAGVLEQISLQLGGPVDAEGLFAYCYALLACPGYVERFSEELTIPGPHVPITKDAALFQTVSALGKRLIFLHTYGERCVPNDVAEGDIPCGSAIIVTDFSTHEADYPEDFAYDATTKQLRIGAGIIGNVAAEVWQFSVSGLKVVKSWLAYRMKGGAGKASSALDDIRPRTWTLEFNYDLMQMLWVLEATIALFPELQAQLDAVIASEVFTALELPQPTAAEREQPRQDEDSSHHPTLAL